MKCIKILFMTEQMCISKPIQKVHKIVVKKCQNHALLPIAHPRLKLFITHGGYNSLMEAARYGIPLISLGFFADQYRNGRVAERNGWALPFEKRKLLEDGKEFRETIWEMLTNPKLVEKWSDQGLDNSFFSY